jgi:hypothetical protein
MTTVVLGFGEVEAATRKPTGARTVGAQSMSEEPVVTATVADRSVERIVGRGQSGRFATTFLDNREDFPPEIRCTIGWGFVASCWAIHSSAAARIPLTEVD